MDIALIVIHVIACFAVILVVLLSKGKGADLGAAFGGSSQTVFGSQGAGGVLTKLVAVCVGIFMLTSLGLAYISSHRVQSSIMKDTERAAPVTPETTSAPVTPYTTGTAPGPHGGEQTGVDSTGTGTGPGE